LPFATSYSRIYTVVRRIPAGRVATYGQIAILAGLPGHARQVGYALHALSEHHDVPWHRVINAQGRISLRAERGHDDLQRQLLEAEGVVFDSNGRVSLSEFGWSPRSKPVGDENH
jgi:methylated-DNA-protein-cysteine methyltransferase-like protein